MRRLIAAVLPLFLLACTSAEEWHQRGLALSKAGKHKESVEAYGKAIEANPRATKSHYNMGLEYARMGHMDQAAACFRKVLELDPADVDASRNLTIVSRAIAARTRPF